MSGAYRFLCAIAVATGVMLLIAWCAACTASQTKTAVDVATRIADDLCKEVAVVSTEPDWVTVACAIEGVAGGIAKVTLPKAQWHAILAKGHADAGPGK